MEHLGAIGVGPLPCLAHIEKLCQVNSTRLGNWVQQNCRPDCVITARFEFDAWLYDPLSITALYGSDALLLHMLHNSNFHPDEYLQTSAMGAADRIIQWGDVSRLRLLFLSDKIGHQLQNLDFFQLVVRKSRDPIIHHDNWDVVFDLVDDFSDRLVKEHWGNELLRVAAAAGCVPVIQRLIRNAEHNPELRSELLRGFKNEERSTLGDSAHHSIGEAVRANHVDVVEYLLRAKGIEEHLRYRNLRGEGVLHLASRLCNPDMFRLLVPRLHEGIYQADNEGDTPLMQIILNCPPSKNRDESTRILLSESCIDWSSDSWAGDNDPLQAAVECGDLEMCRLLVCVGNMDPLSVLNCDSEGRMKLKDDCLVEDEEMLELLCAHVN